MSSVDDDINALQAELERLREVETECELLHDVVNGQQAEVERLREERDAALSEEDRYQRRLHRIEEAARGYLKNPHDINFDVLSAALEGEIDDKRS